MDPKAGIKAVHGITENPLQENRIPPASENQAELGPTSQEQMPNLAQPKSPMGNSAENIAVDPVLDPGNLATNPN